MKKRILLVDDELDLAEVTVNRLVASNYDVTYMADGEQALKWLEGHVPHLILLDLLLPGKQAEIFVRP